MNRFPPFRPSSLFAAGIMLALVGCGGGEPAPDTAAGGAAAAPPADVLVADVGFSTPESVLHDAASDVYLVSNINGSPLGKDDNGFVSRVGPDGSVLALKWIDGAASEVTLHAPKGMAIQEGTIYVADIDCLRMFDAASGAPKGETCPDGATFLNDVAAGSDGSIYFTDSGFQAGPEGLVPSGTDAVYRYAATEGAVTPIAKEPALGGPNGVAVNGGGITVVTFGSGEAYRIGADGARATLLGASQRQLDGVEILPDGSLLVSSWGDQCVYRVGADGTMTKVLEGVEAPADLGYDAGRNRVLVPLFNANRVVIRALG